MRIDQLNFAPQPKRIFKYPWDKCTWDKREKSRKSETDQQIVQPGRSRLFFAQKRITHMKAGNRSPKMPAEKKDAEEAGSRQVLAEEKQAGRKMPEEKDEESRKKAKCPWKWTWTPADQKEESRKMPVEKEDKSRKKAKWNWKWTPQKEGSKMPEKKESCKKSEWKWTWNPVL